MNEKFSGFNTPVEEFFQLYEDIAALNNWSDATKLLAMTMYLSGPAFYYYKTMKTSSTTYDDMKFFFRREFGEPDYRPVQTGPPPREQTSEQRKAEPLVESELQHDENPDDEVPKSKTETEPTTDQTPVECASDHDKNSDENKVTINTAESSFYTEKEETSPQLKNSMENEYKHVKEEEKRSLTSVTTDSENENYSDSEKSEKHKTLLVFISENPVRNNKNNTQYENVESKNSIKTSKPNTTCQLKGFKKVLALQRKLQAPNVKETRFYISKKIRPNIKTHFKVKSKMESSPRESSDRICDSHAEGKVVEGPTAKGIESQAKFREIVVVKKAFPFDRGRRR